ncbi:MAG: DUF433 domain-containing protein [Anaerolineae bacterium]|jgi:uncharacterized protein (DUF433 family)|nr:DUF433 domain-containing protein [Anaerolineae bacterium]
MTFPIQTLTVPFEADEAGGFKIKGTRIPIDNILLAYQRGQTPEQIVQDFDVLRLTDVYATIAYYLQNREEVEAYLARRQAEEEVIKQEILAQPHMVMLREKWMKLKQRKTDEDAP